MKYVWYSIAMLALAFGCGFFLAWLFRRKMKKKLSFLAHVMISIGLGLLISVGITFVWLSIHYSAQPEALAVLSEPADGKTDASKKDGAKATEKESTTATEKESAKAVAIDGGYLLDGPGEETALVFYPGTKVEAEAYLPLMKRIAEQGVDCFLLNMPMNMPLFGRNAADKVVSAYDYGTYLIGGHSLGGYTAAGYAAAHPDTIDGVVLLAAYPPEKLSDSIGLLSIYGSEDKELSMESYERAKAYFPANFKEVIIEGGNHAQFGNYGTMASDGKATITAQEQQARTAAAVIQFAEEQQSGGSAKKDGYMSSENRSTRAERDSAQGQIGSTQGQTESAQGQTDATHTEVDFEHELDAYEPQKDHYNFYFTYKTVHPWWDAVALGMEEAQRQYLEKGITITYEYMAPDIASAQDQRMRLLAAEHGDYDVIGVDVADEAVISPVIDKMIDSGAKVMTFSSSDAAPGCKRIAYVGNTHNDQDGADLTEALCEKLGYRGKVAILVGTVGAPCHEDRARGARETIGKYPEMEIVAVRYDMDSVDLAYDLTKEILEECPDLGGIVCCNMSNPVGAARAVTETKSKAVIVGMDHDEEALHDLDDGVIYCLGVQDCYSIGFDTIQVAVKIADGNLPGDLFPEKTDETTTVIYQEDAARLLELLYGDVS